MSHRSVAELCLTFPALSICCVWYFNRDAAAAWFLQVLRHVLCMMRNVTILRYRMRCRCLCAFESSAKLKFTCSSTWLENRALDCLRNDDAFIADTSVFFSLALSCKR
jgi:hypothetical protein